MGLFDWSNTPKKKHSRHRHSPPLPPNDRLWKLFFWSSYRSYKERILTKGYRTKCGGIGNKLGEHMGTWWTHCQHGGRIESTQKISNTSPAPLFTRHGTWFHWACNLGMYVVLTRWAPLPTCPKITLTPSCLGRIDRLLSLLLASLVDWLFPYLSTFCTRCEKFFVEQVARGVDKKVPSYRRQCYNWKRKKKSSPIVDIRHVWGCKTTSF